MDELELAGVDEVVDLRPADAEHPGCDRHLHKEAWRSAVAGLGHFGGSTLRGLVRCHAETMRRDPQRIGQHHAESRSTQALIDQAFDQRESRIEVIGLRQYGSTGATSLRGELSDRGARIDPPPLRLPLSDRGTGLAVGIWGLYLGLGAFCALAAVGFGIQAFAKSPGPCEAGTVGGLGLAAAFAGFAAVVGNPARLGFSAAREARRARGSITLSERALIVDCPGVLTEPALIDRAWVSEVRELGRRDRPDRSARLTVGVGRVKTAIIFAQPVAITSAAGVPQMPRVPLPSPPAAWDPVGALLVDFHDPDRATALIRHWLASTDPEPGVAAPVPADKPQGRLWRTLVPIAVSFAGVAVLWLDIPRGPGCP